MEINPDNPDITGKMDEWDWQRYLDDYADLVDAGIRTIEEAKIHWISHGSEEGRSLHKRSCFQTETVPLCEEEKKVILIVTIGRTGSTLLMGILNTIDNSMIVGENFGLFQKLWESFKCFNKTMAKSTSDDTQAWYNPELSLDKFLESLRKTAFSVLDSNNSYRVVGLKEIRYDTDYFSREDLSKYLNFIQFTIFNNAYIIFLTRDSEQVARSRRNVNFYPQHDCKYNKADTIQSFFDYIKKIDGHRRFFIDYSELIDSDKLRSLFDFINEEYNEELINNALSKRYSYNYFVKSR